MSWATLLEIIREETNDAIAARIAARARREIAPIRIYIGTRESINETVAAAVATESNVKRAAKRAGVHPATIYRKIRLIR